MKTGDPIKFYIEGKGCGWHYGTVVSIDEKKKLCWVQPILKNKRTVLVPLDCVKEEK